MYGVPRSRIALLRPVAAIAREAGFMVRDSWPTPDAVAISIHRHGEVGSVCVVHARFLADGAMEAVLRLPDESWKGFAEMPGSTPPEGRGFGPLAHPLEPAAIRLAESLRAACGAWSYAPAPR